MYAIRSYYALRRGEGACHHAQRIPIQVRVVGIQFDGADQRRVFIGAGHIVHRHRRVIERIDRDAQGPHVAEAAVRDRVVHRVGAVEVRRLPIPPPAPSVEVVELNGKILLNWGGDSEKVNATESFDEKGYAFEGYNVYQLPSASASVGEGVRVATFDIINGVRNNFV